MRSGLAVRAACRAVCRVGGGGGSSFGVVAVTVGVAVPGTFWGCGFAGVLQVMVGDVVTI